MGCPATARRCGYVAYCHSTQVQGKHWCQRAPMKEVWPQCPGCSMQHRASSTRTCALPILFKTSWCFAAPVTMSHPPTCALMVPCTKPRDTIPSAYRVSCLTVEVVAISLVCCPHLRASGYCDRPPLGSLGPMAPWHGIPAFARVFDSKTGAMDPVTPGPEHPDPPPVPQQH